MRARLLLLSLTGLTWLLTGAWPAHGQATRPAQPNPDSLRVEWADVDRFWRTYDQLATAGSRADSLALVETQYLAPATPGLRTYVAAAHASAADFLAAWRTHRRYLAAIRPATQRIGSQKAAILRAARQLKRAYEASTFPDLYFAIGKFEVGGTSFGNLLYVGAELKCAPPAPPLAELRPDLRGGVSPVAALPTVCLHELVHGQQQLRNARTNLDGALLEGAAEYVAFRLSGRLGSGEAFAYGRRHEAELRRQFAREAQQPLVAKWFLTSADPATGQPGALGYFIGFRICEAYYAQARDKRAALRDIISLANTAPLRAQAARYLGRTGQ